jgi:hypothetical protein
MSHCLTSFLLVGSLVAAFARPVHAQAPGDWPIHSTSRPQPPVVTPGAYSPSGRPSDAIALFDGRSLDAWRSAKDAGQPARWRVRDDYVEVVAGTGAISTARGFGDVQLHVEWMTPTPPSDTAQNRGNSGVFLMERYELQVLDSYRNSTYPDGQASAIYGQHPPLVNASRPPGEWQTYDVVFVRPRFDTNGTLVRPARMTVFHNGVLVQNATALTGPTAHRARPPYSPHADALPLVLQDHGQPVRYRNIWVRELRAEP